MKNILIINEAGDAYPSGRIRATIYHDYFKRAGYRVTYKSYLSSWAIKFSTAENLMATLFRLTGLMKVLLAFNLLVLKRVNIFLIPHLCKKFDVIYLQKVLSWDLVEKIANQSRARLVYDLNDGLWLPIWQKHVAGGVENILAKVQAVTCDNPFGVEFARKFNANSYLIPDSPQVELFDARRSMVVKDDKVITLGWIGTPGTLFNLYVIFEALEAIFSRHKNIHLRLLGSGYNSALLPCFEKVKFSTKPFYSQAELVEEVLKMDIGLFPLFNIDNSNARGVLKATIYMSGETAVIGSAVGQSNDLIRDGDNGMLAKNSGEWIDKLSLLISDADLRKNIARRGLETIREGFTIEKNFEKLARVLGQV
jgi:glycosyltransferase involved in cell wall biosynthesis